MWKVATGSRANIIELGEAAIRSPSGEMRKVRYFFRRTDVEQMLSNRRRYLTADELEKLIKAARKGRYGQRDATLMLLMARHGLRVTEAVDLRWDQIDFSKGHLHVRRLKGGIHSVHPIQGDELRNLRELRREQDPESAFIFTTERGGPMTR